MADQNTIALSAGENSQIKDVMKLNRSVFDGFSDEAKTVFFIAFLREFRADMKSYRPVSTGSAEAENDIQTSG